MVWSQAKLEQVAHGRLAKLGKLQPVERAALAYARWQGLTDEADVDSEAAKRALDKALAELEEHEPMVAWAGLTALAEDLGDAAIIGVMRYSVERGAEQLREYEQNNNEQPLDTAGPSDAPKRKRKKERDL